MGVYSKKKRAAFVCISHGNYIKTVPAIKIKYYWRYLFFIAQND